METGNSGSATDSRHAHAEWNVAGRRGHRAEPPHLAFPWQCASDTNPTTPIVSSSSGRDTGGARQYPTATLHVDEQLPLDPPGGDHEALGLPLEIRGPGDDRIRFPRR